MSETSPAKGLRPGDAVLSVDGLDFQTIGDFAKLTKIQKDMVWEVVRMPDVPRDQECVVRSFVRSFVRRSQHRMSTLLAEWMWFCHTHTHVTHKCATHAL